MVDFKHETAKMLFESSKGLAKSIPSISFEFWQQPDFRQLVKFDHISQTEQDRIFNELEVSLLGLFDLHFIYIISLTDPELQKVIRVLQKGIINEFLSLLTEVGVERYYVLTWQGLIDMRIKEYREDYKTALSEAAKWKEFNNKILEQIIWARIETITIDCLTHIRRGKVEKGDPLWKMLRQWFISVDANLVPMEKLALEG